MQGKRTVFSPDRKTKWVFKKDKGVCDGMPYMDMTKMEEHEFQVDDEELTKMVDAGIIRPAVSTGERSDGVMMIETIRKKYEGFTREQVIAATEARNAMAMMGHPSEAHHLS